MLDWPAPTETAIDHYWLSRPTGAVANQVPSAVYSFGDTAGGRYRPHHGVDIPNPLGTPVLAPAAATVVFAGRDEAPNTFGPTSDFFGNTLVMRLDQAWQDQPVYVLYGHLNELFVETGDQLQPGQPAGTVGMTGIAIGPHLHLEVRLGSPGYENSVHPGLWLQPLAGTGTVAGQLLSADGKAWTGVNVLLYRLDEAGASLYRVLPTYAPDPGLNPDPERAENLLLGDVPAGDYELVLDVKGQILRQRLRVTPGATSYARFVAP